MVWRPMLSCFRGICQVAPMSRLRFFIGKYNLLKLRIDLKAVVYIPICCLNPHFFFLVSFHVRTMLSYIQRKRCLPGTWFIQLDNTVKYAYPIFFIFTKFCVWFHSLLCVLKFVTISCVFFISPYCSGKTRTDTPLLS